MTKENIDLLKELLQAILPILILIIVIGLFLFYRKAIESFLSKITKIKGKIAGQEFETEIKESQIEIGGEKLNTTTDQGIKKEAEEEEQSVEENMYHVWSALNKKDFSKAKQIFEQIQQKETDHIKKIGNEIFYYYSKARNGGVDSFHELEAFAETIKYDEPKSQAYEYLGLLNKHGRTYEKAIEEFQKAIRLISNENKKVEITNYISESYYELGRYEDARDTYLNLNTTLREDNAKCTNLKYLAEFYKKRKDFFLRALTLEKALEYESNNTDILFDLAYSYSEVKLYSLSILHYKTLLFFNNKAAYAHNNIGVSYQDLKLPFKSNKEYTAAYELGNSLAAGNLASNLIHGGFYNEAKRIIEAAKKIEDYDNKINENLDDLNKRSKEEDEREIEIIETAKKQERFLKKLYESEFSKSKSINLSGNWTVNDSIPITNISDKENSLNLTWKDGSNDIQISGSFVNYTSKTVVYLEPRPGYVSLKRRYDGYGVFDENLNHIEILVIVEDSFEIKEFLIKKVD